MLPSDDGYSVLETLLCDEGYNHTFSRSGNVDCLVGAPFLWCGEGLKVYFEVEVLESLGSVVVGFAGPNFRDIPVGKGDASWGVWVRGKAVHRFVRAS